MAPSFADAIARAAGQVVLSGATLGGFAYDDLDRGNGVHGAAASDEEGWITARTLADFVQERVVEWVQRHRPEHASQSLGIGRHIEGPVEALPLAVDPKHSEALKAYRGRRTAALAQLRENLNEVLTGSLYDQVVRRIPEKEPRPDALRLLEEIEALDGGARSQRSLRDFLRELGELPTVEPSSPVPARADPLRQRQPPIGVVPRSRSFPWRSSRFLAGISLGAILILFLLVRLLGWQAGPEPIVKPDEVVADKKPALPSTETQRPGLVRRATPEEIPSTKEPATPNAEAQRPEPESRMTTQEIRLNKERGERKPETQPAEPTAKTTSPGEATAEEPKPPQAGMLFEDQLGLRFRFVPGGIYVVGSPAAGQPGGPEPGREDNEVRHSAILTRGIWLAETELTQKQWGKLVARNPSRFSACGGDCPVEKVSWFEAVAYANLLSSQAGLAQCYELNGCQGTLGVGDYTCKSATLTGIDCSGYRLPTEVEWEVAARGGTTTTLYTGGLTLRGENDGPELDEIAWYGGNSGVNYIQGDDCSFWKEKQYPTQRICGPHPVGKKMENRWGLRDMLGNVREWCGDWGAAYPSILTPDYTGPLTGLVRMIRGGSWHNFARNVRAATRSWYSPDNRFDTVGFRLVRGQKPSD